MINRSLPLIEQLRRGCGPNRKHTAELMTRAADELERLTTIRALSANLHLPGSLTPTEAHRIGQRLVEAYELFDAHLAKHGLRVPRTATTHVELIE